MFEMDADLSLVNVYISKYEGFKTVATVWELDDEPFANRFGKKVRITVEFKGDTATKIMA